MYIRYTDTSLRVHCYFFVYKHFDKIIDKRKVAYNNSIAAILHVLGYTTCCNLI